MSDYLTTRELAELLRIKERKVYSLAASGALPCSRAMGKLLFSRAAVEAWLADGASQTGPEAARTAVRPGVLLGSHDPLLEWAVRESGSGLATLLDGSRDGLERFSRGEGVATGLHTYDPLTDAWNVPAVERRCGEQPVVLVEWAWRDRGLVLPPGDERTVRGVDDLGGRRLVPRQSGAGSQVLLEHLLGQAAPAPVAVKMLAPVRTESDAALAVLEGKADAAFGLRALAVQYRLGFLPMVRERFDLLVDRRSWFEPPLQALLGFCRGAEFRARARDLAGYDTGGLGRVWYNATM